MSQILCFNTILQYFYKNLVDYYNMVYQLLLPDDRSSEVNVVVNYTS